ncbi:MAG: MBL fold metallo-hydrolase [Desulfobulbaceae bacterium]|nr:MBL fold metallo-hydrolase [Desulfobulbaceae bacterium]
MRACIHRGSRQIGGSCVEIESSGQRLLVDFGLPLDAEENTEQYLPKIKGLDGSDPSLLGILISHPHLDHFGLLAHIPPKVPVGMGPAARRILKAAAPFLPVKWPIPAKGWQYQSGKRLNIGPFSVTPFLVDHSAYDAYALLIESRGKSIFYSGDLRNHGRKSKLFERMLSNPPHNIDTLLLEGSSLGRISASTEFPTENDIEDQLVHVLTATEGMALIHVSGQNIDRIVSIFKASKRTERRLIIDLYTAAILEATENVNLPQSSWPEIALYVPQAQRIQVKENAWFDLLKRHSANRIFIENLHDMSNRSTLLFRPLHRFDLERARCLSDAIYVYSQWKGYWEQGSYGMVEEWLDQHAIPKIDIHTSGHASPGALKNLVSAVKPKNVVPIHSFFPEKYPELFTNVTAHEDGEWWEV